jgi:fructose-bisphosphate aldolase/2-amino-3,7-dideoxy-D-threo-hept-6-ulosonate synthase
MASGKSIRMQRITSSGRMVCIPMDHGVSAGPIQGLENPEQIIRKIEQGGATAILAQKGIFKALSAPTKIGMIVHITGSTEIGPAPNRKMLVGSVEESIRLGADAVSVHINIGSKEEPEMLELLGRVADECDSWNMPLVAMMYPRGEKISNPSDPTIVSHVARVGAELGADLVKTVYTGDVKSFERVVKSCPVPIAVAGGPKADTDRAVLELAHDVIQAGAIGVTFGRNIFQHRRPDLITKAVSMVVLKGASVKEALEAIGSN